MNEIILFLSNPLVALAAAQIIGLLILLASRDSDEEIAARSGTCWGHNPHIIKHLVSNNYDNIVGIFIVTLPTLLQITKDMPYWSSYLCLIIGLILRFSPIRSYHIQKRTQKIEIIQNSEQTPQSSPSPLGLFERYLSLWVGLCIVAGVGLGLAIPSAFQSIAALEYASVNLVVAVFIWVMIYPMMVGIDFASLKDVGKKTKGLCITLVINWLIKPFTMAALGILFFEYVFAELVEPKDAKEYIAGMILLGVAPCTAMVFVWSQMVRGDANYTLVQVTINDIIMVFAFAPITAFLLGVSNIIVPWETLLLSVVLYVVIPLAAGYFTRKKLDSSGNHDRIAKFTAKIKPFSIIGLLATVVLLFGFQAGTIVEKPLIIALIAAPLIIQSYGIFAVSYGWAYLWRVPFTIAAPAALIGTSNFFELAVAVAISLFGLNSGAALATVVGVLVEVPVMLSLVAIANRTQRLFVR